ncbi:MAG TPA: 3-deoxy-7-phosphoheptulonate synthase [Elusimicrobia bacterium]|jgi:3-deoxy-7-phosphoheptulonate synthase|nr:3-deoxy-7-phosphoheptulonate synthase [Elusimicrobiota bacterium]
MILTLRDGVSKKEVEKILKKIRELGFTPHISKGKEKTIIGVIGENAILAREIFEAMETVEFITPISRPYKLASREFKKENTVIEVNGVKIGGKEIVVMAGPCAVEKKDLLVEIAQEIKKAGAKILRGGAFKPRTSPYTFQGLGKKGLEYLLEAKKKTGLPIVTEAMQNNQVELVSHYADIIQIGARNIQNFDLLKEVGKNKKPVLLKRGMATTVKEFLMSAEYIMSQGNYKVILCERGIRTFEEATRFTLDLNAVPVLKHFTHLPVIVDPSHGVGIREHIPAMSKAAIACGADGLLIEVHPKPEEALSDGPQSLLPEQFVQLMRELKQVAQAVGRNL